MRIGALYLFLCAACATPAAEATAPPEIEVVPAPAAAVPAPSPIVGFQGRRLRTEPIDEDGIFIPRATVCVPPEAEQGAPLPVLYAFDGDYYVDMLGLCDEVAALTREGAIEPWVVVSVGSTEHRTDTLARHPDDLARVVIEHLEPRVAALVPLASGREHRAVIGYSYGGLAAIHFALARPDDFGRVIAMSPSLWWAGRSTLSEFRRSHDALPVRLYVDAGAREGQPGEAVPYMVRDVRELVALARERGMHFGRDLALREVPGQSHDMALAAVRLSGALRFALGSVALDAERPIALDIDVFDRATPRAPTTFSVNARYASGVVLTWPPDLADVHLGSIAMDTARLPAHPSALTAAVGGQTARRDPE